jgi:signal transduction histidine kinase
MTGGGQLTIRTSVKDKSVNIEFIDNGCGIPSANIKKVFDPLFTTKAKGIGLGLSVSKSILERHGGNITATSEVGRGSNFTVSLPKGE